MSRLVEATSAAQIDAVRKLFAEYVRTVDAPACFVGFEHELAPDAAEMREAQALYAMLGFKPTGPYLREPTPGALCFELRLS